jgi:hypothetical protein
MVLCEATFVDLGIRSTRGNEEQHFVILISSLHFLPKEVHRVGRLRVNMLQRGRAVQCTGSGAGVTCSHMLVVSVVLGEGFLENGAPH